MRAGSAGRPGSGGVRGTGTGPWWPLAGVAVGVLAVLGAHLAGFAFRFGVPLTALLVAGGVVAAVRGVRALGNALLLVAVAVSSWNGVTVAGVPVAFGLLGLAATVLVTDAVVRGERFAVPGWILVLGGGIVVVTAWRVLVPIDDAYLAGRFSMVLSAQFDPATATPTLALPNSVLAALRWLVACVGLPLTVTLAAAARPTVLPRLAAAWVAGVTTSALVAVTDHVGLTSVGSTYLGTADIGGRQAGLTVQANHLAVAVALALPFLLWFLFAALERPAPGAGRVALLASAGVVLVAGLCFTGSRGGLVAAAAGALAVAVLHRAGRRRLPTLVLALPALALAVAALFPSTLERLATRLRLAETATTETSDALRTALADQAQRDIVHAPLRGVGLSVITQAHDIYLQMLAGGGVLLLGAFAVFIVGFVGDALAQGDREGGLARVALVATALWLLVGLVENQITDLYLYVPIALVAALSVTGGTTGGTTAPPPVTARVAVPHRRRAPRHTADTREVPT